MNENGKFRVGIDIGGTFTDIVVMDAAGRVAEKKVSSTVDDYSVGIGRGIQELLQAKGIDPESVDEVVHATTVATNAVLEAKGARTGLVTTSGFRDVLEFRRVRVPELYNLRYIKPKPLVPRRLRLEVVERMAPDGSVRVPLDEASAIAAAERLKAARIEAVAICLLHSYANPEHERRIATIVRDILPPGTFVTCSHEILPEMREYERTSTTVVNAFLGPLMKRYLASLASRLDAAGVGRRLSVMQSNGGQMGVAAAIQKPAYLVESGPAGGVIAAARIASLAGLDNVITLDIGGTTAKTAIVENGRPTKTSEYEIGAGINLSSRLIRGAGYAIKLPFIDVSEIGAGGGSHVWFDKGGMLKVGPESAGSAPGPVCYGIGGRQVTLTDSILALGYLNPHRLAGGTLQLRPDAARAALERQVAAVLGVPLVDAALGVFRVAVANMVRAVKSVSTFRGRDPRDYTLIAFGGNGPLLAGAIAGELSMKRVVIPPFPGVLSAIGLLTADHARELVKALPGLIRAIPVGQMADCFAALEREAVSSLTSEGFAEPSIGVACFADVRYAGQAYELTVPVDGARAPKVEQIEAAFHAEHLKTYGHKAEGEPVELVAIRVTATVASSGRPDQLIGTETGDADTASRACYFGAEFGTIDTPVIRRAHLDTEPKAGPFVVEEYDATILVPPGARAVRDGRNNIIITLEADR